MVKTLIFVLDIRSIYGILKLLDIDLEFDPELFAGIGILAFAAVCAVVFAAIHTVNKKRKNTSDDGNDKQSKREE